MNLLRTVYPGADLEERIAWLIKLRWLASVGLALVILVIHVVLDLKLPLLELYLGNVALAVLNSCYLFYFRRLRLPQDSSLPLVRISVLVNIQISMDLILLTYLLHFSGGIESPFILFFVFHMVMASILLSNSAAYLQATFAFVLLGLTMGAEQLELIEHYHLFGFTAGEPIENPVYFLGVLGVLASTLYIAVYMSTTIVNRLRLRDRELEASNRELAAANKQLEEQDRIKSQYVQTVSHDIQGSLSAIQGCLAVVLDGLVGSVPEKLLEMITRAERRSGRLLGFIKDLLYLSTLRAGAELASRPVSITEFVEDAITEVKQKLEARTLTVVVAGTAQGSRVRGDRDALCELMVRLLDNAVHYTPASESITVEHDSKSGGSTRVTVSNPGTGIAHEYDSALVFKDFYRGEGAEDMHFSGNGLGLPIAKQIVEMHGGRIWIEVQDQRFSVAFELPGSE